MVPGVSVIDWSGMWAPVNTPPAIVDTLNKAVRQVLATPELQAKAKQLNLGVAGDSVDGVKQKMTSELALWKGVAEKARITMKL